MIQHWKSLFMGELNEVNELHDLPDLSQIKLFPFLFHLDQVSTCFVAEEWGLNLPITKPRCFPGKQAACRTLWHVGCCVTG